MLVRYLRRRSRNSRFRHRRLLMEGLVGKKMAIGRNIVGLTLAVVSAVRHLALKLSADMWCWAAADAVQHRHYTRLS